MSAAGRNPISRLLVAGGLMGPGATPGPAGRAGALIAAREVRAEEARGGAPDGGPDEVAADGASPPDDAARADAGPAGGSPPPDDAAQADAALAAPANDSPVPAAHESPSESL